MWSAVQGACSSLALCTSVIRVLCQALDPTAFHVHPVFAAIAEDSVPAHSSATDSTWNLSEHCRRPRLVPQIMIFVFLAFTLSFLVHCFFQSQEPPDTFLKGFSNDYKVNGIKVLPGDPRAERVARLQAQWWRAAGWAPSLPKQQTFTSNSSLYPSQIRTWLCSLPYIPCTSRTIHTKFFSQRPPDDLSRYSIKSLLQVYKSHVESLVGS